VTPRRWLTLGLLVLGGARFAGAQGRVVPAPVAPTRAARIVPAPRANQPRKPRAQARPKAAVKAPVKRAVAAPPPTRVSARVTRQPAPPPAAPVMARTPGSELSVTLITFGVGQAVWERFGHNALWIHDAKASTDIAYNWGLFDFEQPGFLGRFLTGDTKYWMGGEDAYAMVSAYHNIGRPITLQKLNLTPAQALALRDFVERNAREENKYYRYDYFRDNCSTRLRDAVDRAVGGALRAATDTMRTPLSYRGESLRLTEGDMPIQTGIDIALGQPADAPLSAWESFFIPMRLRDAVRIVRVPGANGELVPLVAEERDMAPAPGAHRVVEARTAPDHTRRNLIAGLVLAAIVVLLRLLMRSQRWAAWLLALFGMTWSLLCGALGVALLLAWFATKHAFWAQNENLLLLSPVSLALVVLVPAALLAGRAVRRARVLASLVAVMGLAALVLSLRPEGQPIGAIVALFLPTHVVLAWALFLYLPRRTEPKPAPKG
jgi:hypothetical protein